MPCACWCDYWLVKEWYCCFLTRVMKLRTESVMISRLKIHQANPGLNPKLGPFDSAARSRPPSQEEVRPSFRVTPRLITVCTCSSGPLWGPTSTAGPGAGESYGHSGPNTVTLARHCSQLLYCMHPTITPSRDNLPAFFFILIFCLFPFFFFLTSPIRILVP